MTYEMHSYVRNYLSSQAHFYWVTHRKKDFFFFKHGILREGHPFKHFFKKIRKIVSTLDIEHGIL